MKPLVMSSFVPIILSGSLLENIESNQTALYNDLEDMTREYSISNETLKHITETKEATYTDLLTRYTFLNHLKAWESKTKYASNIDRIVQDEDFQSIVKLGRTAVPLIINELKAKPSFLVWALNFIYNTRITTDPTTTIEEASHKWIKFLS